MPSSSSSSSSVVARTGRHRQRYDDNFRLVSGCIPYRITDEEGDDGNESRDMEKRIQVLMVSSPDRDDRVFPKGGWEDDETILEAASREAYEEAGVKGTLRETPLGVWEFRSKSREEKCNLEGGCRGYMFALQVTEQLHTWPEHQNRDRKWLNIKEAFRVCRYEWMCRALEQFVRVIVGVSDDDAGVKVVENIGSEEKNKAADPSPVAVEVAPVSDVVADECQIVSSNCYIKPSSSTTATSSQLAISVHCICHI